MTRVKHHLLEIILIPNSNGSMREIRYSVAELRAMGIYKQDVMTIEITRGEHARLHHKEQKPARIYGEPWNKGKKCPGIGGRKPGFVSERKGKKYGHTNSGPKRGSHWKLINGKHVYFKETSNE